MTGMSMARSTRSGTGLGPGIFRKWRPWCLLMESSLILPYCIQFVGQQHLNCVRFWSTALPSPRMLARMKPINPDDARSLALDAERPREELSLHDEILSKLRDHIVEGNIADGGRVPERQLCEMLSISRPPLSEALKVLAARGPIQVVATRR